MIKTSISCFYLCSSAFICGKNALFVCPFMAGFTLSVVYLKSVFNLYVIGVKKYFFTR